MSADRIRALRERAGMTQAQLADVTGIAQPHLSAYESGARTVTPRVLDMIEDATRVRPSELVRRYRDEIRALACKYGADSPRVFGSVARGTDTPDSDIDLVVRFRPDASLGDVALLQRDLRELLGVPVEVVSEGALRGRFGHRVAADAVPV
ncbi:helix-turn-helix domain-containing protein [Mycobacterium celatum]|nr:helix-turn-helix domain-containing protein [Mycobacterium celatum]